MPVSDQIYNAEVQFSLVSGDERAGWRDQLNFAGYLVAIRH
jgi:hypothetical protein